MASCRASFAKKEVLYVKFEIRRSFAATWVFFCEVSDWPKFTLVEGMSTLWFFPVKKTGAFRESMFSMQKDNQKSTKTVFFLIRDHF